MEKTGQLHAPPNTRLGGPNSQVGHLGEEKSLSLAGNRRLSRLAAWPVTYPDSHMKLQHNKIVLRCCSCVQVNTSLLVLF
jgi:hypothetical protein